MSEHQMLEDENDKMVDHLANKVQALKSVSNEQCVHCQKPMPWPFSAACTHLICLSTVHLFSISIFLIVCPSVGLYY